MTSCERQFKTDPESVIVESVRSSPHSCSRSHLKSTSQKLKWTVTSRCQVWDSHSQHKMDTKLRRSSLTVVQWIRIDTNLMTSSLRVKADLDQVSAETPCSTHHESWHVSWTDPLTHLVHSPLRMNLRLDYTIRATRRMRPSLERYLALCHTPWETRSTTILMRSPTVICDTRLTTS